MSVAGGRVQGMKSRQGLCLEGISKSYGAPRVLEDINLSVEPGQILGITGPSGAGKTTICRLISGIEKPEVGSISLAGRDVTDLAPQKRGVAYMFESYALYPQLTVADNVAFALRSPALKGRFTENEIGARVKEVLELTELGDLAHRLPAELSGGQKQRVALCRALAQQPAVWLLDEPISHLDAKLRNKLRGAIRRRQLAADAPTIWTSPDAMETLSVADTVAVLIEGCVQQQDSPERIFLQPANTKVARLVGDPAMNLLRGRLRHDDGALVFEHEAAKLRLPNGLGRRVEQHAHGARLVLGVRPNSISIHDGESSADKTRFAAEVYAWEPFGKYSIVSAMLGRDLIKIKTSEPRRYEVRARITVSFAESNLVAFEEESGNAI